MKKVSLRPALGTLLILLAVFLSVEGFRRDPAFGWILPVAVVAGAWVGWALRQTWVYPARLAQAEALWAAGDPASAVAERLAQAPLATGELGYRIRLLRSVANQALGYRDRAWLDALEAHLARLPLWKRLVISQIFRRIPGTPSARRLAWGDRLIRLAPRMARLHHLQGILLLRSGHEDALHEAWAHFEAALPLAWDDPLVLEDLMLAGLQHGREDVVERALAVLASHHGDPRLPWDRGAAGMYLLRNGRPAEALALVAGLPRDHRRDQPLLWLTESVARRRLGDLAGAWQVAEAAVSHLPDAFQLWMERYQIALERGEAEQALGSLERAWRTLPAGPEGEALRQEWQLRRAEFAFWWEDDPTSAKELLAKLPPEGRGDHHPPILLQVEVALGQYETAYGEVAALLRNAPDDTSLLLLQADCLAGMDAWEALLPYLNGLSEACRGQADFWHLRGLAQANLSEQVPARLDLERAVRMDSRNLRYLLDAGHGCAELGDWDRAESHWRQALQVDGQSEEALLHLAEARRELEDLDGARRYLRECLLHHPDSEAAQAALAELESN
ncbi:tetratricopeptide repeat protein [Geothrix fuzhouensis]|uniref:tetratricopeptide repeat protein n=1 Tax=Geothrix fuzhouensis TaxID=2966451 RepID=UPI0021473A54|nr:tetratricopeptide repeat protein [Geothrix fuzhouensis]